jgi:hypothetical protein
MRLCPVWVILATMGSLGPFGALAADTDPLKGFVKEGVRCPGAETGVVEASMTNSMGQRRIVQTTYQYGIPTLVALFSQTVPDNKTLIIALDPKTDPNPLAARLAAVTRGCFNEILPAVVKQAKAEAPVVRKKKPRRQVVHRPFRQEQDYYRRWGDNRRSCRDFRCSLFGDGGW